MEKLAQPLGNAKICGEFDRDAATAADPNPKDEGPFQRLADLNLTARRKGALALLTEGIAKESHFRSAHTSFRLDHDVKMIGPSIAGRILATRSRRFNGDTQRLAAQALVVGASAILVLGFLIQASHQRLFLRAHV
jgi:hypothetical protein